MRARLYLNSMVAFSAALSAAPRWNEPAWVGVSKGLEVRGCGWLEADIVGGGSPAGALTMAGLTGRSEHCCVGMVERRSPCQHAQAHVVIEPRAVGWAVCAGVQWAYRQSAWATRRGRAVGGGYRWLADVWCTFL